MISTKKVFYFFSFLIRKFHEYLESLLNYLIIGDMVDFNLFKSIFEREFVIRGFPNCKCCNNINVAGFLFNKFVIGDNGCDLQILYICKSCDIKFNLLLKIKKSTIESIYLKSKGDIDYYENLSKHICDRMDSMLVNNIAKIGS